MRSTVSVSSSFGFTPRRLSGCVLWLRADIGLTFGAGAKIATWADRSGSGNDLTQGTGANQPSQTTNAINGCPAITFSDAAGTNLASSAAGLGPTAAVTMIAAMRRTASQAIMFVGGRGDTGSGGYWIGTDVTDALKADIGNGTTNARPSSGVGSWTLNGWMIASAVYDGANGSIYKNGGAATSAALTGAISYTAVPTFYLGNTTGLIAGRGMTGDIAECAVFNRALNARELASVHQYLSKRYAIAVT